MTAKRQPSPRLPCRNVAGIMHCCDCLAKFYALDADRHCKRCGGPLVAGPAHTSREFKARRPVSCGVVGVRDPLEQARTEAALRAAREEAQG